MKLLLLLLLLLLLAWLALLLARLPHVPLARSVSTLLCLGRFDHELDVKRCVIMPMCADRGP